MKVEVKGVNFINKGAELMLRSVLNEFEERNVEAKFCINLKDISLAPPDLKYLRFYPWRYSKKIPFLGKSLNFLFEILKIKSFKGHKVITRKEIDVILDASGFAYSEQWGPEYAEVMAQYYEEAKSRGQKVILLPQAFGPFESKRMKEAMRRIINVADLIFARDNISFESLKSLKDNTNNIFQCPDFTIKMKTYTDKESDRYRNKVCIIPNYRMVDMRAGSKYLDFLDSLATYLTNINLEYYFLIHESDKDRLLVEKLQERRNEKLQIVIEDSPVKIKQIIGSSKFVVGSRFHGIVGALTQNIPTIATGWSHKYKMLYKEYNLEDFYINDLSNTEKLETLINELSVRNKYGRIEEKLKVNNQRVLEQVNDMWEKSFSLIDEN